MITLTLIPKKFEKYWSTVEIQDHTGYPMAITQLDLFWKSSDRTLYDKLNKGETVVVELVIQEKE